MTGALRTAYYALLVFLASCILLPVSGMAGQKTLSGLDLDGFKESSSTVIDWDKNPFVQPAGDVALDELKLTGVIYNPEKQAAILDDQVVEVGDKIGYSEVLEIGKTYVILRNENGMFRLSLKGGGS